MKTTFKFLSLPFQTIGVLIVMLAVNEAASASQAVWIAVVGTSTDTNWSDLSNWQSGVTPNLNNCVFNDTTGVGNNTTINNVVNTPENPSALLYTNIGTFQNTLILPGDTLTIGTGGLTMGNTTQFGANPPGTPTTTISGAGATLVASNDTVNVGFSYQATAFSGGATAANINMSGLDNFVGTNLAHVYIGEGSTRMSGALYLATNNDIYFTGASSPSSPNLDIGDNSSNNGPGAYLYLGQTNVFWVNDIGMGLKKQNSGGGGEMSFNSAFNNPVAFFYGTNGPGSLVSTWAIGDGQTQSGTITDQGSANFSSGTVYANVNNMWLGRNSTADSGSSPASSGTLTFSDGNISVNNLTNGWIQSTLESPTATGTINVNGTAVLNVTKQLVLAATNQNLTGTATFECQGFLYINGGSVLANSIVAGGGGDNGSGYDAYVQMTGGLLAVTNTMGSAAYPVNYLLLESSPTLQLGVANNVTNVQVQTLASDGSTAMINISSLPVVPAYPTAYPILAYQDGTGSGDPFSLGALPGTYMGYVSNDNSSTVWLVITNGPPLPKLDQWGGGVNDNWDTTTKNWTNNGAAVTYNENDSVLFNDFAQTATVNLTSPHTPFAWTVTNDVLNYTFSGSGVQGDVALLKSGTASLNLAESGDNFNGGISVLGGTLVLDQSGSSISGGLNIAPGATAQIGNNDANGVLPGGTLADSGTLAYDQTIYTLLSTSITGVGGLTQGGSGVLALSAANTYTGNTLVNGGTLALTNGGSISQSAAVTVNNATLDVSGAGGAVALNYVSLANASVNVSVSYLQTPVTVAGLNLGGAGNTMNIAALPPIAAYPATINLIQSDNPITGSDISVGTLPPASPSYAGSVSVSGNQVVLTLTSGPVGTRPYVTWSGADVPNLHTNWSDGSNWQEPGAPTAVDNVIFTETAAQAASALSTPGGGASALSFQNVNNIVDANFTISSLTYTNVGGTYQNTFIDNGETLTITNGSTNSVNIFSVGSSSTDFGASAAENVTISGPNGTLNVNNTNDTVFVGLATAGAGTELATMDMSGLGSFNASVNSFAVGAIGSTAFGTIGTAYLAQTNIITAFGGTNNESGQDETMSLMVGETGKNGAGTCYLYLGQQNTINANYIGVSLAKEPAEMEFNPVWSNPSATIRAANGVSPVAVWSIGDGLAQSGGSTTPTGVADFTGGTVNALVQTMYIGRSPDASGPHAATGTLTFDAGTFAAGTIYDGYQAYGTSDNGAGTVNVSGTGLLQVGTINLAWTTSGESSPTTGALNITNGTAQVGTVVCDSHGAGQSTITLVNGTLVITNTAGATGAPLAGLNLTGGTLQLDVNGAANVTNIVATSVTTSGTTMLSVGSLTGVATGITYPLINYTGSDPYANLSLSLPAEYQGTLVDNPGVVGLQLTTVPPSAPPRFTHISVSGGTLTIAGTNGVSGGSFILLETTNLAPPVHWTPALTNSYNANGAFNVSASIINPGTPAEFFTLTNVP